MRLSIYCLISGILFFSLAGLANASSLNEKQLSQELKQAENTPNSPNQSQIIEALQSALNWLNERENTIQRTQQYQKAITGFPKLTRELQQQLSRESIPPSSPQVLPMNEIEQQILQLSSHLLDLSRQLQQEQDRLREIGESLTQLPQKQSNARRELSEAERRLPSQTTLSTPLVQAQAYQQQAEVLARQAWVDELELEQLSANNRQELSRLQTDVLRKRHDRLDMQLQALRNMLNNQRQREAERALEFSQQLVEQNSDLPHSITEQLKINQELSYTLNQYTLNIEEIINQQRTATEQILKVRQALGTLREQAQWLGVSTPLGETLRAQIARLPDPPKPQPLDNQIAQLRVQQLHFNSLINKTEKISSYQQNDGQPLTNKQQELLKSQLKTQRDLLNSLLSSCDSQILELTKLKQANIQLIELLVEVQDATHRYLFWLADVEPITLSSPLEALQSLNRLLSLDTLSQLSQACLLVLTSRETLFPLFAALLLMGFSFYSRRHYYSSMARASSKVGKVTQDHITLTLRTLFWSILVAFPLPILWAAVGYALSNAWPYPIAVAIGDGVIAALPVLWIFMISAALSHPDGLFIAHFHWPEQRVKRAMRYYQMSIWLIVPLLMALEAFDNFDDRDFASSLGRICFIMLCIALNLLTTSLKRAGLPLYLNKEGSRENLLNHALWGILLCAPLLAAFASVFGYFNSAKVLLARLESSVAIWFILLVIYHIIRRWMLIQRRRIAFERAKQRRAERLEKRTKSEDKSYGSAEINQEIEEPIVDLDAISAQSLRLVRSILTMFAFVSLIWLWSELHSAFAFLENIRLWEVSSSQGDPHPQSITFGAVLIAILVIVVTIQLVKNLPALLELGLLQHLDLTPGTGYAITTITKYLLMLLGCLIGFSMLGIEWSKLQWLVAALTVGLGFGLQEIFANFVSGLIILFEKPIRIGDTVTIRELTGTITKINTRATTLSDWDRKEIIVPNKAFITEQFINWSLSDAVTRVVLSVPAEANADSQKITELLLASATQCHFVLEIPAPEAYLVNIQQGIQLFELRIYAAEMAHRMPLRHEVHQRILAAYQQHELILPFPPVQVSAHTLRQSGCGSPLGNL